MERAIAQDRLLGAKVGNYEVTRKLGEGGMGAVYLAVHPDIGKRVALKVLHPELSSNEEVTARFFNEAKAVNDIQHPNIVDIIDYGEMPSTTGGPQRLVYFIMEFLPGDSLAQVIREQAPLPPERARLIAIQIADALGASHRHGIVHRDLKPDNVMIAVQRDGRDSVKVLDFGIAKLTGDQPGSRRTRTGMVLGTPSYMSPEQCEGRGLVDHRTDLYSLGILLYEMLTGQVPFRGEGYGEVLVQHMTQLPPRPSAISGAISAHLEAVCMKALEKRPFDRFGDMEEFMRGLQDPVGFVESHGGLERFLSYAPSLAGHEHRHLYVPGLAPAPIYGGSREQRHGRPASSPTDAPRRERPGLGGAKLALIALGTVGLGMGGFFAYRELVAALDVGGERPPVVARANEDPAHIPTPPGAGEQGRRATVPAREAGERAAGAAPASQVEIVVESTPAGAQVFVAGETRPRGNTPVSLKLARADAPVEILLKADGYSDERQTVIPSENRVLDLVMVPEGKPGFSGAIVTDEDTGERKARERDRTSRRRERKRQADRSDQGTGTRTDEGEGRGDKRTNVGDDVLRPDI